MVTSELTILWHMPTLRRVGCGLSRRAVELGRRLAAMDGHAITFVVEADKIDIGGGTIGGLPVHALPGERRTMWHWSMQAKARRKAAERQIERILGAAALSHDLFISCQPEAVRAYAAVRGPSSSGYQPEASARADQPEALARESLCTHASARGRSPVLFVCGGTTLLHDAADEKRQASLSAFRRALYHLDRRWKQDNERQAFVSADAVVFDSDHTREAAIAAYGIERRRCHTVYGGVDEQSFRPPTRDQRRAARTSLGLPLDGVILVWTGRLSPEKNVELLLRALPNCRRPPDAVLLVGDGPEAPALRKLAADDPRLGGRVRFVGEQPDVRPFLYAADIFAFPSRGESFGGALAEAMACGLACAALRPDGRDIRTASTEIIEHQRCGLLADPPTAEAFAAALDRLATHVEERWQFGLAARRRVCQRFTWDAATRRLAGIISELVRPPGRSDIVRGREPAQEMVTQRLRAVACGPSLSP